MATRTPVSVSAVITTKGRQQEVSRVLASLAQQTFKGIEVVVVDQNDTPLPKEHLRMADSNLSVRHLHTPGISGASRGRNDGLEKVGGDIVFFPDDDCWYPPDFVERCLDLMQVKGADLVAGRAADETGRSINGRFADTPQWITRSNVWITLIEWVIFARRDALEEISGFDEAIGVGASTAWQSCEVQDVVLRLLSAGFAGWYEPDLYAHHEELPVRTPDEAMRRKGRRYARGFGYVLRKHGFSVLDAAYWTARPAAAAALLLARGNQPRFDYYRHVALGRAEGFLQKVLAGPR